jgi:hypothetical protein
MKIPYALMHTLHDLPDDLKPLAEMITDLATDLRWT